MRHPSESELALAAGGELGFFANLRVRRHLGRCPECRAVSQAFAEDRMLLGEWAHEFPADVNWHFLASEMKAYIRVGVEADECVAGSARGFAWASRPALALASALLTVVLGYWLNMPQPALLPASGQSGVTLEATRTGIELKQDDRSLTLLNPGSEQVAVSVNMQGVLRARYVDSETGHVTITNVYAQ
jgi:anti-sigma factor RsiW